VGDAKDAKIRKKEHKGRRKKIFTIPTTSFINGEVEEEGAPFYGKGTTCVARGG